MQLNDREMLELAAKATGLRVRWHESSHYGATMEIMEDESGGPPWNPLTDDGDLIRLESALEMSVLWFSDRVEVAEYKKRVLCTERYSSFSGDRHAARRAASVRAAATVGKFMVGDTGVEPVTFRV